MSRSSRRRRQRARRNTQRELGLGTRTRASESAPYTPPRLVTNARDRNRAARGYLTGSIPFFFFFRSPIRASIPRPPPLPSPPLPPSFTNILVSRISVGGSRVFPIIFRARHTTDTPPPWDLLTDFSPFFQPVTGRHLPIIDIPAAQQVDRVRGGRRSVSMTTRDAIIVEYRRRHRRRRHPRLT